MPPNSPPHSGTGIAASPSDRGHVQASSIVGLLCLVVYTANFRSISGGDAYPARYLPFAMWHWDTVFLDPVVDITAQGRIAIKPHINQTAALWHGAQPQDAFWVVQLPGGHAVSLYPLAVPILVAPLYLPAVIYLNKKAENSTFTWYRFGVKLTLGKLYL